MAKKKGKKPEEELELDEEELFNTGEKEVIEEMKDGENKVISKSKEMEKEIMDELKLNG